MIGTTDAKLTLVLADDTTCCIGVAAVMAPPMLVVIEFGIMVSGVLPGAIIVLAAMLADTGVCNGNMD